MKTALMAMVVAPLFAACVADAGGVIVLGSKKFTESFVLAEMAKRSLEEAGFRAEHRQGPSCSRLPTRRPPVPSRRRCP